MATLQFLVLGGILLWSGMVKLRGWSDRTLARKSIAAQRIGETGAVWFYRAVGVVESVVAVTLLVPPANQVKAVVAAALSVGFVGYLVYGRVAAPTASCGCLSAHRPTDAWRGLTRAGLMVLLSLFALLANGSWLAAVAARPAVTASAVVVEAALLVALSAELDGAWLLPLRRLRVQLSHPLAGQPAIVPVAASVHQLLRSAAYQAVAGLVRSDVLETWDEDGWRILAYAAQHAGAPATAVFAVPIAEYRPELIRAVLTVDATDDSTDDDRSGDPVVWRFDPEQHSEPNQTTGLALDFA